MEANPFVAEAAKFIFAGVLGYGLKWALERMSAEIEAKRKFAEKVTEQIMDLAKNHYWHLANHAGLLARLLEDYSQRRIYLLLRRPDDWSSLRRELEVLADGASDRSFPYLCRLLRLFNAFQFEASNTYLFADNWAGERARRLYNRFVDALREGGVDTNPIIENANPTGSAEDGSVESTTQSGIVDLTGKQIEAPIQSERRDPLGEIKAAYREWLHCRAESVVKAAEALGAYSELLDYELKLLYKTWFKSRWPRSAAPALDVDFRNLPLEISEAARKVIDDARFESTMLSPIGAVVPGTRGPVQVASGEKAAPTVRARGQEVSNPNVFVVVAPTILEAGRVLGEAAARDRKTRQQPRS